MVIGLGIAMIGMAALMVVFGLVLPKEVVRRSKEESDQ